MRHPRLSFWVTLLLILLGSLSVREWQRLPDGKLHIHFLSIGQGDATLLELPDGKQVLIDGGMDWAPLEAIGKEFPFFDRSIDFLILSHDNADHLMALPEIVERYKISAVGLSGYGDSGRLELLESRLKTQGTQAITLQAGKIIDLGSGVMLEVLWPPSKVTTGLAKGFNDVSIVMAVSYQGKRILFTGDIEAIAEETLVKTGADLHADILKVAHHGSKTSSTEAFLKKVSPRLAVISNGLGNSYGHPHQEVLERYKELGIEVHRTDMQGDLEVVW